MKSRVFVLIVLRILVGTTVVCGIVAVGRCRVVTVRRVVTVVRVGTVFCDYVVSANGVLAVGCMSGALVGDAAAAARIVVGSAERPHSRWCLFVRKGQRTRFKCCGNFSERTCRRKVCHGSHSGFCRNSLRKRAADMVARQLRATSALVYNTGANSWNCAVCHILGGVVENKLTKWKGADSAGHISWHYRRKSYAHCRAHCLAFTDCKSRYVVYLCAMCMWP